MNNTCTHASILQSRCHRPGYFALFAFHLSLVNGLTRAQRVQWTHTHGCRWSTANKAAVSVEQLHGLLWTEPSHLCPTKSCLCPLSSTWNTHSEGPGQTLLFVKEAVVRPHWQTEEWRSDVTMGGRVRVEVSPVQHGLQHLRLCLLWCVFYGGPVMHNTTKCKKQT